MTIFRRLPGNPGALVALALTGIVIIGAVLRLSQIGSTSIAEDEAYHAVTASAWANDGAPIPPSGIPYTRGLPLILLEKLSLEAAPLDFEAALRLPVALLGVINVLLVFLLGNRYAGAGTGLAIAAFFAVSQWAIAYGTNLRMYELLLTCSLLVLLTFERLLETRNMPRFGLCALALCLGIATHQLGLLLVLIPFIGGVLLLREPRAAATMAGVVLIGAAFWQLYPVMLEALWPVPRQSGGGGSIAEHFIGVSFAPLRLAWDEARVPWLAGALLGAVAFLKSAGRRPLLGYHAPLPWIGAILVTGLLGFMLLAGTLFAGYFAMSGVSDCSDSELGKHRRHVLGWLLAIGVLWLLIAVVAAPSDGAAGIASAVETLKATLRFPDLNYGVLRPLLAEPKIAWLTVLGLAVTGLLAGYSLWAGPIVHNDVSFAVRVLFLLAAAMAIATFEFNYRHDRYIYFLLPAAVLSLGQVLAVFAGQVANRPMRHALGVCLAMIFLYETSMSVRALPWEAWDGEGSADTAALSASGAPPTAGGIARNEIDYRAIGSVLDTAMADGDILLADAAHQIQVYVPRVHGHLSPPLNEYDSGTHHYFTGSVLLRQPQELICYLAATDFPAQSRVWIVITDYPSQWTESLPPLLADDLVWRRPGARIFKTSGQKLESAVREQLPGNVRCR